MVDEFEDTTWEAIVAATTASKNAIILWGRVFYPLISGLIYAIVTTAVELWRYVSQAAILFWPYIQRGAVALWEAIIETDPVILCAVAAGALVLFLMWLLKRTIVKRRYIPRLIARYGTVREAVRQRYQRLMEEVRRKSRTLAALLPHLSVAVLAGLCVGVFPALTAPVISGTGGMLLAGAVYPALATMKTLKFSEPVSQADVQRWLSYWTVFTSFMFATHLPFVPDVLDLVPYWNEASFFFVLWLLLPWTDGAEVGLRRLIPFISTHIRAVPQPALRDRGNMIINALVFMRIINDEARRVLIDVLNDAGSVILLGAVFVFTPGFVTHVGCLLVGVGYPIFASATALASMASETARRPQACLWWLTYWGGFAVFTAMHEWLETLLGWVPLWYHAELVLTMWLQLPYFRGADRFLDFLARRLDWGVGSALAWATPARTQSRAAPAPEGPVEPSALATPSLAQITARTRFAGPAAPAAAPASEGTAGPAGAGPGRQHAD